MPTKHSVQTTKTNDPAYDVSKDAWNAAHNVDHGHATIVAGQIYVDVTHGVGSTPDIDKIILNYQSDMEGLDVKISNVGATTFRINISGMAMENLEFGWVIL